MAQVTDYELFTPNSSAPMIVEAEYSFAADTGAQGVLDMIEFGADCVIHRAWIKVKDSFASVAAAELIIGVKGGDTDAVLKTTLEGDLTAGSCLSGDAASVNLTVASGDVISMTIGTDNFTAGRFVLALEVSKF